MASKVLVPLKRLSEERRHDAVAAWVINKEIMGELKQFKKSEIDRPARYEELRQWLGLDHDVWVSRGASTVEMACNAHDTPTDKVMIDQEGLQKRVMLTLRRLVALTKQVPGAAQYPQGSANWVKWCYQATMDLLFAVLFDPQHDHSNEGFFARRLQGAPVLAWQAKKRSSTPALHNKKATPKRRRETLVGPTKKKPRAERESSEPLFVSSQSGTPPPKYEEENYECQIAKCIDKNCPGTAAKHRASVKIRRDGAESKEERDD
ncbi:uncharacterized protein RCC_05853 [Ramularia collo-cygni]|uniref:Uncharacterized protein n=1 Tax=Ramularia collo-cygni TaxID=112498 RepID=A0A2D3V8Q7_9PEZI|nr:uncharacterized protein RCC_05853 [Ramularia collo-cygni]CZT19996.1 uncharacterized protein RCC_05853 [Ramularia collo-cygni]